MKQYGFGVDIGGTTCKIGFFDAEGMLLEKWEIATNVKNAGASILDDIVKEIETKRIEADLRKEQILGIGMGVPGPVLPDGTVNQCVNLGWGTFNVADEMARKTAMKVKIANDANVAALGELWQGSAVGYSDAVMVTLGTGVGGGVIINGKILAGASGAGGELGHIPVNSEETECCSCGKRGCLEQYVSATGIVRMAQRRLGAEKRPTILRQKEKLTAKDIFEAAKKGDVIALELVSRFGKILGTALATIACVVNPQIFILGGGVSNAGEILLEVTKRNFEKESFHICRNTEFVLAKLGNDAGIYGGMRLVMDQIV